MCVCRSCTDSFCSIQVDTALKQLEQDADADVNELEDLRLKKTLISAAKALQLRKIDIGAVAEISKNCQLLLLQGVELSLEVRLAVTKRVAIVAVSDENITKWLSAISIAKTTWEPTEPCLGGMMAELEKLDDQDVGHVRFRDCIVDCVFSSSFQKKLNMLNEENGDPTPLLDVCKRCLQQLARETVEPVGPKQQPVIDSISTALRGLLCLCAPLPPCLTSALDDLTYVVPKNASTAAIIADLPKAGRLLVTKLRSEVPEVSAQ